MSTILIIILACVVCVYKYVVITILNKYSLSYLYNQNIIEPIFMSEGDIKNNFKNAPKFKCTKKKLKKMREREDDM